MKPIVFIFAFCPVLLLAGCASIPSGPSVMALPGSNYSFDQFRSDDGGCRRYAQSLSGASQSEFDAGVRSAVIGTVIGAVAGAAIGGQQGAGVGAGTGLLFGSVAGAGAASNSTYGMQRDYDNAYVQCMYAKGHKVPVPGNFVKRVAPVVPVPAPAAAPSVPYQESFPPPPPGYAPPPPPGVR